MILLIWNTKEQKLKALIDARRLCKYSLQILQNNKYFKTKLSGDEEDDIKNPPQPEYVAKMRETVMDIYISAYSANETYLNKGNYKHRRQLQDKAISKCNEMMALIEMGIPIFHISLRRVKYWIGQLMLVRSQLSAWKDSDYKRYKRM